LTWNEPTDNGGSEITGYELTMNNWADKVTKTASEFSHTYTGLTNGTEYTFKVRAVNANGAGAESSAKATPQAGGTTSNTWTKVENTAFGSKSGINSVVYGGGKFVAVGNNSEMAYSSDGITWTTVTNTGFTKTNILGTLYGIADIAYGGGKFVAVGGGNQIAYSTDGINWTSATSVFLPTDLVTSEGTTVNCIAYGNGKFVAGGWCGSTANMQNSDPHGAQLAYSTDGVTWTAIDASVFGFGGGSNLPYYSNYVNSIIFENGKFIAGGKGIIAYSADGINWTAAPNPFSVINGSQPVQIYDIAYGAGKYVAVGQNRKMAYSANGTDWTEINSEGFGDSDLQIQSIAFGNGKFYAGAGYAKVRTSIDGTTWTSVSFSPIFDNGVANSVIREFTYGAGKFIAVGAKQETATSVSPIIAYSNQ
jgi:hypothetical protein